MRGQDLDLNMVAERTLEELWREQGLPVVARDGWLELEEEACAVQCTVLEKRMRNGGAIAVVAMETFLGPDTRGVSIVENMVGVNPSIPGAVVNAVRLWVEGVFPAVRAAWGHAPAEARRLVPHVELAVATPEHLKARAWRMYAGSWQISASEAGQAPLLAQLEETPPLGLLRPALEAWLVRAPELVWIKLFMSRQPDGAVLGECLLSGREWSGGWNVLAQFAWPESDAYQAVRQFCVLRRQPAFEA